MLGALPAFLQLIIILGGIFGGWFTATEAAGLAVIAALAIGLAFPLYDRAIGIADRMPMIKAKDVYLNRAIGWQTLPVASVLITSWSIARANIWEVSKVNVYFVRVLQAALALSIDVPAIPMTLVELSYR